MKEELKSQLIEELNKAIQPDKQVDVEDDGRVHYHHATHSLEINEEANVTAEGTEQEEKKPDEDEMFEDLIRKLNEQKYGHDKKIDMV